MNPVLFEFGPLTIYSYGVCVALGFLAAIVTAASRAKRYGGRADTVYDLSFYVLIAAIAGSRLLYVMENPGEFVSRPWEIFMVWRGGLVFFGGLIAAVAAGALFLRHRGLNVAEWFDLLVPSVALGHAIGRVGCYLNGCCFGSLSALPWAVVFPKGSPVYLHQLYAAGYIPPGSACSLPVHPVQLYSALMELGIFGALSVLLPRKRFNGQIFLLYILLYGTGRFLIEFLRADNSAAVNAGLLGMTVPQAMSLAGIALALVLLFAAGRGKAGGK